MGHIPVLLDEVVAALNPQAGEVYLDGTFGGGGYATAILQRAKCTLIGVDRDLDAIARAEQMAIDWPGLIPQLGRFGDLDQLASDSGFPMLDGVVLDLGVSSFQLDESDRGFSFQREGPLDMRMGQSGPSAADVVNALDERGLAAILFRLGEEKASRRVAKAIVMRRADRPFETTLDLATVVSDVLGGRKGARTHPATRTFQALRMYVNDELGELARGLVAAERCLRPGGRLVVVTFHSLEDRMVKQFLRQRSGLVSSGSRHLPGSKDEPAPSFVLSDRRGQAPHADETAANPRARSSRLRVGVRSQAEAKEELPSGLIELPPLAQLEETR